MTESDSQEFDELIIAERFLQAVKAYRALTDVGINAAKEATMARERTLREEHPERFKTDADYRRQGFERLAKIERKVLGVRAY